MYNLKPFSLIIILFSISSVDARSADYYCPLSNIYLQEGSDDSIIQANSTLKPLYLNANNTGEPNMGQIAFKIHDCSTKDFKCMRVQQAQMGEIRSEFFLILPILIETEKEYTFNGMKVVTQTSELTPIPHKKGLRVPIIQAILWQKINGKETPIKLTIEENIGVTYWSGVDFWSGDIKGGETCTLKSNKGFFSDILIGKELIPHKEYWNTKKY